MFASIKSTYLFLSVFRIVVTGTGVSHKNINNVSREGLNPHLPNPLGCQDLSITDATLH